MPRAVCAAWHTVSHPIMRDTDEIEDATLETQLDDAEANADIAKAARSASTSSIIEQLLDVIVRRSLSRRQFVPCWKSFQLDPQLTLVVGGVPAAWRSGRDLPAGGTIQCAKRPQPGPGPLFQQE